MENKIIFREMLTEIKKAADAAGNVISREEIRELLGSLPLEEEHFQLICQYLEEQNITVVDFKEEAEELPEEEERRSLSIYLDELASLEGETFENEQELLKLAADGDRAARSRLVEEYLPRICEMAGEYEREASGVHGKTEDSGQQLCRAELPVEDLIQEGNLGLLMAFESLGEFDSPAACRAHLLNSINQAMEQAIKSSRDERRMGEGIASRVNHLNEAVHNLERDLEHRVSAEELSAYLEMPLEEIRDILRMSGDQIDIEGNGKQEERQ